MAVKQAYVLICQEQGFEKHLKYISPVICD